MTVSVHLIMIHDRINTSNCYFRIKCNIEYMYFINEYNIIIITVKSIVVIFILFLRISISSLELPTK